MLPTNENDIPKLLDSDVMFPAMRMLSEGMQSLSAFRDKFVPLSSLFSSRASTEYGMSGG